MTNTAEKSNKDLITDYLKANGPFENSKHALIEFCKANPTSDPSQIWFYRIFQKHGRVVTKKDKIKEFIRGGSYTCCKDAFAAYAVGENKHTSFNYFTLLYGQVKAESKKGSKVKKISKTVDITNKSAKEITQTIESLLKQKMTISLKDKKRVLKTATTMLQTAGYTVR